MGSDIQTKIVPKPCSTHGFCFSLFKVKKIEKQNFLSYRFVFAASCSLGKCFLNKSLWHPEVSVVFSVEYTGTMFTDFTLQDHCVATVSLLLSPLLNALEPGWWNRGGSCQLSDPHDHCGPLRPWTFCDLLLASPSQSTFSEPMPVPGRSWWSQTPWLSESTWTVHLLQGLDCHVFNQAARILYDGNTSYVALMTLINIFCFLLIPPADLSPLQSFWQHSFIHYPCWAIEPPHLPVSPCVGTPPVGSTLPPQTISSVLVWWYCVAFCTVLLIVMCLDAFRIIWSHFTMNTDAYLFLLWWLCEQFWKHGLNMKKCKLAVVKNCVFTCFS